MANRHKLLDATLVGSLKQAKSIPIEVAGIWMVPQNTVGIDSETVAKRIVSLMEAFDDHDDVQNAYANFDIPDEVMAKVS